MSEGSDGGTAEHRPRTSIEQVFASELCHRVANEFAAVSAALSLTRRRTGRRSARLLDQAIERVDAFVAIHRLLIPPLGSARVDLAGHLEGICLAVAKARLAPLGVSLTLRADDCVVDARTAWILSLLVTEALTNVAKHAFAEPGGEVAVTLGVGRSAMTLRIADDGRGATTAPGLQNGAGSAILSELSLSIGGTATRVSTPNGTMVEIVAPVSVAPRRLRRDGVDPF